METRLSASINANNEKSDEEIDKREERKRIRNREYQRAWYQRQKGLKKKVSKAEKEEERRKRHRENQRAYYQRQKTLRENEKKIEELFQTKQDDLQMKRKKLDSTEDQENVAQCKNCQNLENKTHGVAVQDTQTADLDPGVSSEIEVKKKLEETFKRNMTCSDEAYSNALATGVNIIIARVYKFFKSEYEYLNKNYGEIFDVAPFSQYKERTSEATGFDVDVVSRALEELEIQDGGAKKRKLNVNDSQSCEDSERMQTKLTPVFIKMEKVDAYEDSQLMETKPNPEFIKVEKMDTYEDSQVTCALSDKSKDPLNTPTDSLENAATQVPEAVTSNPLNIKVERDNPESDEHLSDRGIIIKEEIDIGKEEFSKTMANSFVSLPWTTDDGVHKTAEENRSVRQSVPVAVDGNLCLSVRPLNIKNTQREYLKMGPPIGRIIGHQAKQITYNLYNYFKDCKLDPDSLEHQNDVNLAGLVAYVTGMSESTVRNIVRLGRSLYENTGAAVFKPPKKNKIAKKRIGIDNFTEGLIRRKITQFYTVKQEIPTLRKLNSQLKQDAGVLSCSREFLRTTLHRLGFRYKKFQCKRKLLIERSDITAWRWYYLLTIKKLRSEGRPIFYLDETYVELSNNVASFGKGRLIIIHAGGRTGFVHNGLLIFKAPSKLGDSHITSETLENYIKVHLLPNLPNNSVIVMDNAACHCRQIDRKPTITSTKNSMQEWLTKHDVPFDETMRKCNLMQLIDSQSVPKQYVVDEIINQAGHAVLRLPQNHSDLNPMEIVWGEIKRDLEKSSDSNTNIDQKQAILENLFANYSAKQWSNCDDQVVKIEDYYYEDDMIYDDAFDRFVSTVFDDSDSEDKSGGSSDDEYTECDDSD